MTHHHYYSYEQEAMLPRTPMTPLDEMVPQADLTVKLIAGRRVEQDASDRMRAATED